MSNKKKADISPEQMEADGWVKTTDPAYLYKKAIPNRNPINCTPEDSDICLIVHGLYNQWTFAVQFPDGGLLNFVANSMDDLKKFESMLNFYDPPF